MPILESLAAINTLYPQKRTLIERVGMSALCQQATSHCFI
jgi:hypothetical protein